ncbi:uncharacterized protein EI90DRAFT_2991950 [Cantharellus anzutake]|uniref:uncharacterized protein n=1 Tax=Cantharellus anzutake TaxID=1750568 RepID=UPI0019065ABE|nr:uncharacterized protein EI90DRAFT_2991950 [Cantharellus anzutake]KAF8337586.1 hypothetical protein EI90DRAFT_2991950 [Cantharellus anzutake]
MKAFASELYAGQSKIIIAIDIGTSNTGVSYAYLYPSGPQAVTRVSEWPGQPPHRGESKIPTLIWYNRQNQAVAYGAEAVTAETQNDAADYGWRLAKQFKLHLHPSTMRQKYNLAIEPLPPGVGLTQIYQDFLAYLLANTRQYFVDHVVDGVRVWNQYFPASDIVIAHPNGWGIREQDFLRSAVAAAGWTRDSGSPRIHFITEGEASVHYCMFHADLAPRFQRGISLLVCDAGGSTVDSTTYQVIAPQPQFKMKEIKASACVQAGGIFVNLAAEQYLRQALRTVRMMTAQDLEEAVAKAVTDFEANTKRAFQGSNGRGTLDLGAGRLTVENLGIRRGRMNLDGNTIESFFKPLVDQIIASALEQMEGLRVDHVLLVGGFGESPYLREALRNSVSNSQVTIVNDSTAKAVSDGAVIWCSKQSVVARACRFQYGIVGRVMYNPQNPKHVGRRVTRDIDGINWIPNTWFPIVRRGDIMAPGQGVTRAFSRAYSHSRPDLGSFSTPLYVFTRVSEPDPYWAFDTEVRPNPTPGIEKVCDLVANLSGLSGGLEQRSGPSGTFWHLDFRVGIEFGGTELVAYIEWTERGMIRRGSATIIPHSII